MPRRKRSDSNSEQVEQTVTLIPDEERTEKERIDDEPAVPEVRDMPEEAPVDSVIRIGEKAEGIRKLNGFDRFWIKIWSYIVSAFVAMANGINFVISKIFKKRIPNRYIIAVLAVVIIVLLMLLFTAPFKITVNDVEEMEIYSNGLTPVYMRTGDDATTGYPVYKWGYANEKGRVVIPCIYEDVTEFKHGVAFVNLVEEKDDGTVENYWCLIDTDGKRRGDMKIYYSTELGDNLPVGEFGDEVKLAPVYAGGKYGYMNTRGEMQIKSQYAYAGEFVDGYARVRLGNSEYFINEDDEMLGDTAYEEVRDFCEGFAAVKQNDLWSFIDTNGEMLLSNKSQLVFDKVTDFKNGYALVRTGMTLSVIDQKGNFVVTGYTFNDLKIAERFDTSWW